MQSLDETIEAIRGFHRRRCFVMEQRKRMDLALGSFLRLMLGWRKDAPEAERKKIMAQAASLIKTGEHEAAAIEKNIPFVCDEPAYEAWRDVILGSIKARKPFSDIEAAVTKEMEKLAETLPVWSWSKDIRGLGARSLAVIVGEAGDLSAYPKKGHLWKRMGLAVMGDGDGGGDIRQGGLSKNAPKDDWIAHGYSPKRRSQMYVIGDVMVKVGAEYRQVYLDRKEYERAKFEAAGFQIAPAAKIPDKRAAEFVSDGHIHRRAQRYMEKRLLRDLLVAWKNAQQMEQGVPPSA